METDEERKARLEKMVATTQLMLAGPGDRGRKKSKKKIGFDLDIIWIEIGVFKNKKQNKKKARSPCNGNHFLVYV